MQCITIKCSKRRLYGVMIFWTALIKKIFTHVLESSAKVYTLVCQKNVRKWDLLYHFFIILLIWVGVIHLFIHFDSFIHIDSFFDSFLSSFTDSSVHWFTHWLVCWFIHWRIHRVVYCLIQSFCHWFIHKITLYCSQGEIRDELILDLFLDSFLDSTNIRF